MTTNTTSTDAVTKLVKAAADATKSEDAMRFSQAALNAANALECIRVKTP